MSSTPRNLDDLVSEARQHLVPETHGSTHDWSALDRALEERVRTTSRHSAASPRRHAWALASGVALAAAAAATLVFRPAPPPIRSSPPQETAATVESAFSGAPTFRIVSPIGDARGVSSPLLVGDRLETGADEVSFISRSETGTQAVAWRVEAQSQLLVARARAPLGLTLQSGAVEADVARVQQGEAFVVDVGSVRVAVKGTHLRVARAGDRVTVDLSEGTIAIGPIPAAGLTTGQRVTAPAHVEFDLARPTELRVVNDADAVRARGFDHDVHRVPSRPSEPSGVTAPAASPAVLVVPRPLSAPSTTAAAPASARPLPDTRSPQQIVRDAVRECFDKSVPAGPVRVAINSTLTLDVDPSGVVKLARFEPPLSPQLQACASESIYKTRFLGSTTERISISAER